MEPVLHTVGKDAFVEAGVEFMATTIQAAIEERGHCVMGLSGGSTPAAIYEELGKRTDIDWTKVIVFLVDDRYIAPDDPKSNQYLLRSTLLKHAPIPEPHIVFPDTDLSWEACSTVYDAMLKDVLQNKPVDLITLGLGGDGHIASLFPPVTEEAFGEQFAIQNETEEFDVKKRISSTMRVLTSARIDVFFLKGQAKKAVWDEMMASDEDAKRWPAKAVIESESRVEVIWGG